jgi:hypothetical protein
MKSIKIFSESTRFFNDKQRKIYSINSLGELDFFMGYPNQRIEPELIYIDVGNVLRTVQGQYMWPANISHLLFDVMSDFFIARQIFGINKIILEKNLLSSQICSLLNAEVIQGKNSEKVENLHGVDYNYVLNPWRFRGQKHLFISRIVRETFFPFMVEDQKSPKNIIITRRVRESYGHKYARNIENLDEFIRNAASDGCQFETIDLEAYSIKDQIKIFYNAEKIIAAHGSGLAWLNFCKPCTKIIEIITPYFFKDGYAKPDFWFISQNNYLDHKTFLVSNDQILGDGMHPYDHNYNLSWGSISLIFNEVYL